MELRDYGVTEVWTPKTTFLAFFGIRTVQAVNRYHSFTIAIVGVPPWRSLKPSDFHEKRCYEASK